MSNFLLRKDLDFVKTPMGFMYVFLSFRVSVALEWDWPNVLVCNSKSINSAIKISIVLERRRLQQFIEVVR